MEDRPLAQNPAGVRFILVTCGAFWLMVVTLAVSWMMHASEPARHTRRRPDDTPRAAATNKLVAAQ